MARRIIKIIDYISEDYIFRQNTKRSVAKFVGIVMNAISSLWNNFQEIGNVRRLPQQSRPYATTPNRC